MNIQAFSLNIFSYLNVRDICALREVCKGFRTLIDEDRLRVIWRGVCLQEGLRLMTAEESQAESYRDYVKRNWEYCRLDRSSPIHKRWLISQAARMGHEGLLSKMSDKNREVALEAAGCGFTTVVKKFVHSTHLPVQDIALLLTRAIKGGCLQTIQFLLEMISPKDRIDLLAMAIIFSAGMDQEVIVRYLLKHYGHQISRKMLDLSMNLASFLKQDAIVQLLFPFTGDVRYDEERVSNFFSGLCSFEEKSEVDEEFATIAIPILSNSEMIGEVLQGAIKQRCYGFLQQLFNHPGCASFILDENIFHAHLSWAITNTYNHWERVQFIVVCLEKSDMMPLLETETRFPPYENHIDIILKFYANWGYSSFVIHILKYVNPVTLQRRLTMILTTARHNHELAKLILQNEHYVALLSAEEIIDSAIGHALENFCSNCFEKMLMDDREKKNPERELICPYSHSPPLFEQLLYNRRFESIILQGDFFHTHLSSKIIKTNNPQFIAILFAKRKMISLLETSTRFYPYKNHIDLILSKFASLGNNRLVIHILKCVSEETLERRLAIVLAAAKIDNIDLPATILRNEKFVQFLNPQRALQEFAFRGNLRLVELLLKIESLERQLTKEDIEAASLMLQTRKKILNFDK